MALGRRLRVMSICMFLPIAAGRWAEAYGEVLSAEEMERVRRLQDMTFVHFELPTRRTMCCAYAGSLLHVCASGDVTPCGFVPYVLGNVRTAPLADIWRRHMSALRLESRGVCPMNEPVSRAALREHVESVASGLGRRP